jgi:hypothetical protein
MENVKINLENIYSGFKSLRVFESDFTEMYVKIQYLNNGDLKNKINQISNEKVRLREILYSFYI